MKKYIRMHVVEAELMNLEGKQVYRVVYPDGYQSFCPKEAFEASGTLIEGESLDAISNAFDEAMYKFYDKFKHLA